MKTISCLLMIFLTVLSLEAQAGMRSRIQEHPRYVTGIIVELKGNLVTVKDERGIDRYRFFTHSERLKDLRVGDRVRVFYESPGRMLLSIKKMTPVECRSGQNLGNVGGCR